MVATVFSPIFAQPRFLPLEKIKMKFDTERKKAIAKGKTRKQGKRETEKQ